MQGGLEGIMNALHATVLCFVVASGGWACSAQETTIPFGKIEQVAHFYPSLVASTNSPAEMESSSVSASPSAASPASSAAFVRPTPVAPHNSLGSKFYMLNGLHLGMAMFDVAMTQRCIANHTCHEGNPIMPSSAGGQVGIDLGMVGWGAFVSYKLVKERSNLWWIAPAVGAGAHGAGVATGFAH
jgi:hypothetical protein